MNERELLQARLNEDKIRRKDWGKRQWVKRSGDHYVDEKGETFISWENCCNEYDNSYSFSLYIEPPKEYTFMEMVQRPGKYRATRAHLVITVRDDGVLFGSGSTYWVHTDYFLTEKYIEVKD